MATIFETVSDLAEIVTDAITAGVDTNVPTRNVRNSLIRVSTGKYQEVLPIIVPAETCIIGDELRSTNVQPRKAENATLTPKSDFQYSYQGIKRFETIIDDIVDGVTVSTTTGNTLSQTQSWPYSETPYVAPAAKKLARTIRRRADFLLGDKLEKRLTPSYDMSTPEDGYHRDVVLLNKEFIQEEIIGYLADEANGFTDVKYSRTKCKQDVGYILDALAYDLTYGGNYQSVNAGEAYYNGRTGALQISSTEKDATLAAYGYLQSLVQTIGRNIAVTPTYQSTVTQITGYNGGNSSSASTASQRIQDIINIITNGTGTVSTTYPSLAGVDATLKTANTTIESAMTQIGEDTIDFISLNFGSFKYDAGKCRRDLRKIITDTSYDIALGTNFNAVYTGIAYQRPNNSYNLQNQRSQTVGAIRNARDELQISVTTDGSSAVGSSNASTRIATAYNEIVDIINNGTLGTAAPGDGTVDALTFPEPTGADQNRIDAKDNLIANRDFIIADIIAYIANNYAGLDYDQTKCERDVGFIVDALCYDILYQGTQATTRVAESYFVDGVSQLGGEEVETSAAYGHLKTVVTAVVTEDGTYTKQSGNLEIQTQLGSPATATEATELDNKIDLIIDVIDAGNTDSLPAAVYPSITWADAEYQTAHSDILSDQEDVIRSTIQYINTTYNDFNYDHAKCKRDLRLIALSARYDFMLDSNFASIVSAYSYLREPSAKIIGNQKEATIAANEFARQKIIALLPTGPYYLFATGEKGNGAGETGYFYPLYTNADDVPGAYHVHTFEEYPGQEFYMPNAGSNHAVASVTDPSLANLAPIAGVNNTWLWVEDMIWSGSAEGNNSQVESQEIYNANRQIELNKEYIVQEALNFVDNYFQDTATGINAATDSISISDTSWLSVGMGVKFEDADDSTSSVENAGLSDTTTYYVKAIISDTDFVISTTQHGSALTLSEYGEGFIVKKSYEYNRALCARDVREYLDAIKWDIQYPTAWPRKYTDNTDTQYQIRIPGSYKTRLAARYYANSIIGSQEEDFFYLRNGTGLRLMTLAGLAGDLGPPNEYGTSRPTAGAYASLDPGWGPSDQRAWIIARSPYVQNVTTFGTAATGQRIDGALHDGGNDSIVSNDFTQVISDGIGAHILNNGRAELVSVFTYYSYIGYLAETGGRIRATNGNNSYGTFGSVAEGVDPDETAVTGVVDNRTQYSATISNVLTDANTILQVEYSHAGNEYTKASFNFFGAGSGEIAAIDEFRDNAVFQGRVIEVDDSTGNPDATAGGSGYLVVTNTAQTGSSNSLTLAATDGNLSTAYPGMKVYITGGAGTGLFGIIDTYNAGTKIATVIKETDGTAGWDHVVPGTTFVSPNSTSTYLIEPRVSFTAPTQSNTQKSVTSDAYNAATFLTTSKQYVGVSVTTESDGLDATFDVVRNGSKYFVSLNSAGTGYTRLDTVTIPGTSLDGVATTNDITITVTSVNSSTGAIVDFDFVGKGLEGKFILVPDSGTTAYTSTDGDAFTTSVTLQDNATAWNNIAVGQADDGSSTLRPSFAVLVGYGATNNVIANYSTDGTTWVSSSPTPALAVSNGADVAFGQITDAIGRFVIIGDNDRDVAYSDDGGVSWTIASNGLPSTGYTSIAYGAGKFVAVKNGSQEIAYSEDGISWTQDLTAMPSTAGWTDLAWGNGRFVAITDDTTGVAYSLDGETWVAVSGATVGTVARKIAYGQGMFVVTTDDTNQVSYSEDGIYWPSGGYTLANTYTNALSAIAFGNPQQTGQFVAVQGGTATNAANIRLGATAKARAGVANEQIFEIRITEPGSGYTSTPDITITDPNNIDDVLITVRTGNGVIAQPSWENRGAGFITASAEVEEEESDGFADFFQDGAFVAVKRLSSRPVTGSNVVFDSLPNTIFKLVNVVSFVGDNDGSYKAFLNISPNMEIEDTPPEGDGVTMRIRFSQVRLTGHDFLDIGTGNFDDSNYPTEVYGDPVNTPDQTQETQDSGGGRVFFTSTDQDGNFRVGDLFSVEQATGVATLNADAFNIAGLQELSLGEVTLGGNSAAISEFSTDPFFTANSDTVVPTQRAVKAYIEAQIGGGGASLNVNSVTAGDIFIGTTQITTVSGATININANINFTGSVLGVPLAVQYFLR